jgi:hypothetical protein
MNTAAKKNDNFKGLLLEPKLFEKYKSLRNGAGEIHLKQKTKDSSNLFIKKTRLGFRQNSTISSSTKLET